MITAVDSSVLIDEFGSDPVFGANSADALRTALREGRLVACSVVWAEVSASFPSPAMARQAFSRLGLEFSTLAPETALQAGMAWKGYRERGGPRTRIAVDFLIGAHALLQADRLLTRDGGFFRSCFRRLSILDPANSLR